MSVCSGVQAGCSQADQDPHLGTGLRAAGRSCVKPGGPGQRGMDAAHRPLGNSSLWSKEKHDKWTLKHDSYKGKRKSGTHSQPWCWVLGRPCSADFETHPCGLGVSPPCGLRETNRRAGPRGLLLVQTWNACRSHGSGRK